jgi:hypothetical protein
MIDPKEIEKIKKQIEESDKPLQEVTAQIMANKNNFTEEQFAKFNKELDRVNELKKELDGLTDNR